MINESTITFFQTPLLEGERAPRSLRNRKSSTAHRLTHLVQ